MKRIPLSIAAFLFAAYSLLAQSPLVWQELGPTNIGGRTRALLIDHRDASRATIYAGGVSGGLWKSTDHGDSWSAVTSVRSAAVSCIAQDANGRIYFGTGEGLAQPSGSSRSSGTVGDGLHFLYGNDQDSILPSAMPAHIYNAETWSCINRVAINPNNVNDIYAATSGGRYAGLQHSLDGGQTWTLVGSASAPISGHSYNYQQASDVKISADGNIVMASVGYSSLVPGCYLIVSQNGGTSFTIANDTMFNASLSRIEIGMAPSDPSVAYVSIAKFNGSFGGIYQTSDAGSHWHIVGQTGSAVGGIFGNSNQGWFDNVISVHPLHSDIVMAGGQLLYTYSSLAGWSQASVHYGDASNPNWVHPDMHAIVFDDKDSNAVYIGCDGGVFRSNNVLSHWPTPTFVEKDRGYATLQCFSVAADLAGNVAGGTEDNGTVYVDYHIGGSTYGGQVNFDGGDAIGSYVELSRFNPNVIVAGSYNGQELRSNDHGANWVPVFDRTIDPVGYGEPSICGQARGQGNAAFVTAIWLVETETATNNISKVPYADYVAHSAGDLVTVTGYLGIPFDETLIADLPALDTTWFADRLQSRLYVASSCGLWMTPDILDFTKTPRWFCITHDYQDVKSLAATSTGDTLYTGGNGTVTRITGMNSIPFDTFSTGSDSLSFGAYPLFSTTSASVGAGAYYVEGVDVDVHNPNHVLCTIAGFGTGLNGHVFSSSNSGTTWAPVGGGLPAMPVYQCVIDAYDAQHYIVGTDRGFWDSHDAGASWAEQNGGILMRDPVFRLRQQPYLSNGCYALYAGTHGRGMWRCITMTAASGCAVNALGVHETTTERSFIQIYPNPNTGAATFSFTLPAGASNASLHITDLLGKEINSYTVHDSQTEKQLDTRSMSSGIYLVSLIADGRVVAVQKMVVE